MASDTTLVLLGALGLGAVYLATRKPTTATISVGAAVPSQVPVPTPSAPATPTCPSGYAYDLPTGTCQLVSAQDITALGSTSMSGNCPTGYVYDPPTGTCQLSLATSGSSTAAAQGSCPSPYVYDSPTGTCQLPSTVSACPSGSFSGAGGATNCICPDGTSPQCIGISAIVGGSGGIQCTC